jgi:hypothetical protein
MVEEIFMDELSIDAQKQLNESQSEDSQQIIKTLAVINYLKVTVLVIIGFILRKWRGVSCLAKKILVGRAIDY